MPAAAHDPDPPANRAARRSRAKIPPAPGDRELRRELGLTQAQLATLRSKLGADQALHPWLTRTEAARYLGYSYRHLTRLIDAGELSFVRRGRTVRIHVNTLDAFLAGKAKAS